MDDLSSASYNPGEADQSDGTEVAPDEVMDRKPKTRRRTKGMGSKPACERSLRNARTEGERLDPEEDLTKQATGDEYWAELVDRYRNRLRETIRDINDELPEDFVESELDRHQEQFERTVHKIRNEFGSRHEPKVLDLEYEVQQMLSRTKKTGNPVFRKSSGGWANVPAYKYAKSSVAEVTDPISYLRYYYGRYLARYNEDGKDYLFRAELKTLDDKFLATLERYIKRRNEQVSEYVRPSSDRKRRRDKMVLASPGRFDADVVARAFANEKQRSSRS